MANSGKALGPVCCLPATACLSFCPCATFPPYVFTGIYSLSARGNVTVTQRAAFITSTQDARLESSSTCCQV